MPAAQEVSPEGEPEGRSSPGGGGLSQKMGPLPLWGWLLAGAGVFLVVFYTHKRSGAVTSVSGQTSGGGAPPGDNSAVGPTPDPNGATLRALLLAMQDQAKTLSSLVTKVGNSQPAKSDSGVSGVINGLTADQQALLQQNVDFYKKKGLTSDQINAMINASTGPNAPRGVIAQSKGIDYLQGGFVLPTYPPATGGAVGGPRWTGASDAVPNPIPRKRRYRVADILEELSNNLAPGAQFYTSSHTDPAPTISSAPVAPAGFPMGGYGPGGLLAPPPPGTPPGQMIQ